MLELASLHKEKLMTLYRKTWRNPKYMYFHCGNIFYDLEIYDDTRDVEQLASLDKDGNIVGFLCVKHRRDTNSVCDLVFLSFTESVNHVTARDLLKLVDSLFESGIRKISFGAICGNPIMPTYDKQRVYEL